MQTETLFRAARAIEIVSQVIDYIGRSSGLQHSFQGVGGTLFVTLTGALEERMHELVERMNERASDVSTSSDERFSLEHVAGNIWRVEAR